MNTVTSSGATTIFTSYQRSLSIVCGTCRPSTSLVRPLWMGCMALVRSLLRLHMHNNVGVVAVMTAQEVLDLGCLVVGFAQ